MIKKQKWMFKGALVLAIGKKATIKRIDENNIKGVDYVYYIYCQVEGEKKIGTYHPSDIDQLIPKTNNL